MPHCLVLHPGLKLEYFRLQHWEQDWIETAENLAREEYITTYQDSVTPANSTVSRKVSHYIYHTDIH
jgi:hypothetical protein